MEETRKQLAALMQQYSKTQKQISKETDLSTATISQFLDGSYKGDNEKVKSILDKYIEMTKDRGNNSPGVTFYKDLYNTKETLFICRYAHLNNDIALICGEAGAGKTTALNYYKDNNIGVVIVTADPCCSSSLGILKRITKTLNRAVNIPGSNFYTLEAKTGVRQGNGKFKTTNITAVPTPSFIQGKGLFKSAHFSDPIGSAQKLKEMREYAKNVKNEYENFQEEKKKTIMFSSNEKDLGKEVKALKEKEKKSKKEAKTR